MLSGGLDSATALYYARNKGYDCRCLIFDYGQRHKREIDSAKRIAKSCDARHTILKIEMPWKGSALLDKNIKVPRGRQTRGMRKEIPSTYVPARNTVFLSFAVSYAEAAGAEAIFIGANSVDFSGYPDCRPHYYRMLNRLIPHATKARKIRIMTPLINMTKSEIIKLGNKLGVPHKHTWSCYSGGRRPCGTCDSCLIRAKGFKHAGVKDPAVKG